ncbi:MAG: hypothetical protein Q8O14_04850 [bacterium]|jgi:hypothetical protein|nr:hypothetical protein [bacterium]
MLALPPLILLLAQSCGEDSGDEDRTPPPAPGMRLKNCSTQGAVWPETGVDAEAAGGQGIRLEWEMAEEPDDLAGFLVFRALDPRQDFEQLDLDAERFLEGRPAYFHHVDQDPVLRPVAHWGPRAWYFVKALDRDGNTSAPSDTVTYRLWAAPRVFQEQVQAVDDTLRAAWQYEFVHLFNLGFGGFRLLAVDAVGTLAWSEDVLLGLEPQMSAFWSRTRMGLAPGSYQLRIDTIIGQVAQIDSLLVPVRSNPENCPLAGSESVWISFTF